MFECTGALVKCCKGHVNESSRHANSICSLSEEHQSLAGIKMRLLKLQQPFFAAQLFKPRPLRKPRPPTSLSTNWALCFKAMEITEEKREDTFSPTLRNWVMDKEETPYLCCIMGIYMYPCLLSMWNLWCSNFSYLTQIFWNKTQVYFLSKYQLHYLFSQLSLFKQYSTGFPKGHTLTC